MKKIFHRNLKNLLKMISNIILIKKILINFSGKNNMIEQKK